MGMSSAYHVCALEFPNGSHHERVILSNDHRLMYEYNKFTHVDDL